MKLLIATLLSIQGLCGQITWQQCPPTELPTLKDSMLTVYSEQLAQAGLFKDAQTAKEAARPELDQEDQSSTAEFFYYYLAYPSTQNRCGYLVYSIEHARAYLEAIHLEEEYQGQGLGREILQDLENVLKTKAIETLRLYVFAHNHRAFALYQKMGYEIETTYFASGIPVGSHMKKELLPHSQKQSIALEPQIRN